MRRPETVPEPGLPESVTIYEVGARDGLQNEAATLPTAVKAEFIVRLASTGLRVIEATSVVHPQWVPQLADAEQLLDLIDLDGDVRYPVLVPNERGLDRALAHGVREIAVFASATETFARRNLNRTVAESMQIIGPVVRRAREAGLAVRGYVSMCFGDPWEGAVPVDQVVGVGAELLEMGCYEISLGDTIGVATAGQVTAVLGSFATTGIGPDRLAVHFHNTYGQALANTLSAMRSGVTVIDSSAGGLGGCPYAKNATGNLATEDLLWMLDGLGIATGVDLDQLIDTSLWMSTQLGKEPASGVVRALGAAEGVSSSAATS
jgi:hydroxymethylglutaryl-CoA lyase